MKDKRQRLTVTVSPAGELSPRDWKKIFRNMFDFTLPIYLIAFFGALSLGVDVKAAALLGLAALYGPLRDFWKKLNEEQISK
jgi:hypothetical protein